MVITPESVTPATEHRFLSACRGRPVDRVPVWLMRQAGRYQPSYRAVRAEVGFLELCRSPELVARVTLAPIDEFGFDAAILFSDILIALPAMGLDLSFEKGEKGKGDGGPRIAQPASAPAPTSTPARARAGRRPAFVAEAVAPPGGRWPAACRSSASSAAPSPWRATPSRAAGRASRASRRSSCTRTPPRPRALREADAGRHRPAPGPGRGGRPGGAALRELAGRAGARGPRGLQLPLPGPHRRGRAAHRRAGAPLRHRGEHAPAPRSAGSASTCVSVDWRIPLSEARAQLPPGVALQGNLDPVLLLAPREVLLARAPRAPRGGRPRAGLRLQPRATASCPPRRPTTWRPWSRRCTPSAPARGTRDAAPLARPHPQVRPRRAALHQLPDRARVDARARRRPLGGAPGPRRRRGRAALALRAPARSAGRCAASAAATWWPPTTAAAPTPTSTCWRRRWRWWPGSCPRRRQVTQLHWGGGTPTFLDVQQLRALPRHPHPPLPVPARRRAGHRDRSGRHHRVAAGGPGRPSASTASPWGCRTSTRKVQEVVGRIQGEPETADLVEAARDARVPRREPRPHLRAALPDPRDLDAHPGAHRRHPARPHGGLRLRLRALGEAAPAAPPRSRPCPRPRQRVALFLDAVEAFTAAGYRLIGLDHFALESDELARAQAGGVLTRNFQGYTVRPAADTVAFGMTRPSPTSAAPTPRTPTSSRTGPSRSTAGDAALASGARPSRRRRAAPLRHQPGDVPAPARPARGRPSKFGARGARAAGRRPRRVGRAGRGRAGGGRPGDLRRRRAAGHAARPAAGPQRGHAVRRLPAAPGRTRSRPSHGRS